MTQLEVWKSHPEQLLFIGIDPGATGAIAVIDQMQQIKLLQDWPGDEVLASDIVRDLVMPYADLDNIECLFDNLSLKFKATIERVHSMPGQGVRSMFSFGTNYGIWRGILASFQIPFLNPTPQAWQKGILSKQDALPKMAAAGRMFPRAVLTGPRGGHKDGRADALLIADYCRRQF